MENNSEEGTGEYEPPNYSQNVNLTPSNKREINWDATIEAIKDRAIQKEEENILLPIYRYSKLVDIMGYHLGTIIHEC